MSVAATTPVWSGIHASFDDVEATANPFDESRWVEACRTRVQRFREQVAADERPPLHDRPTAAPAVIAAMAGTGAARRSLRVLDYGGGAGVSYLQVERSAPGCVASWAVLERAAICPALRALHAGDARIRFDSTLEACGAFDFALFGSSLHYLRDWRGALTQVAAHANNSCTWVLLEEVPAVGVATFATGQRYYDGRIPVWMLSHSELVEHMRSIGFALALNERYPSPVNGAIRELPMDNFPATHRVGYASTYLFART